MQLPPLIGGGFWVAFVQISVVYYAAAVLLWALPAVVPVRSIQVRSPRPGQIRAECLQSIGPLLVKAAVLTIVEALHTAGVGLQYDGPPVGLPGVAYMVLTWLVLDALHDSWFYWTHRLLHCKALYKHVHYMHHQSNSPTPFTGYSFHVVEAAIVFANEIIVCFLFPIHARLHRLYHLATTTIHNGGHAGYEIAPFIPSLEGLAAGLLSTGFKRAAPSLNTVAHHDWHHRYPTRHFSLYFTHWDRWCGTLHPEYDSAVDGHFSQQAQQQAAKQAKQQTQHGVAGAGAVAGVAGERLLEPAAEARSGGVDKRPGEAAVAGAAAGCEAAVAGAAAGCDAGGRAGGAAAGYARSISSVIARPGATAAVAAASG